LILGQFVVPLYQDNGTEAFSGHSMEGGGDENILLFNTALLNKNLTSICLYNHMFDVCINGLYTRFRTNELAAIEGSHRNLSKGRTWNT